MSFIYPDRESKNLEFKSQLPAFHTLAKTCVAFANGSGGKIIIGIDDKTRKIIGVNNKTRDRIYDELPNSLYDIIHPTLAVEIYEQSFNDVSVMIIEVPFSSKKPVFIKSEGMPHGVYLRAGSNTRRATQEYIEERIRENKRIYFDEETIHAKTDILSQELIKTIFHKANKEQLIDEKIIGPSAVDSKKISPTVAGVLTFCDTPDLYIPEALIRCTQFKGTTGRDIIQSEEIKGPLEKQIENSFQLVKSWLTRDYQLSGTKLKGKIKVPEIALREAISNALIHRKYWIPGAIKIALYDNRLEIFSPGNFPGLFNTDRLGDGTTYLRNPNLARIARRFGIVEKLGTGIRLIFESCQKAKLKAPEFIEGEDSVKVIFTFSPADNRFASDDEKLLSLFEMRKEVRLNEVTKFLNVSRNTATRKLNQLIKSKKIKRLGKGPAVKYVK
jgi:ATP-dependent DNA helicase RecG